MLGNKEDKEQEPVEEQIIGLDLNLEQATITYLSFLRSVDETENAIKNLKDQRNLPIEEREEEFKDPDELNGHIQLANYTLEKLRYLLGEVKTITIELAPPEKEEVKIIKPPKWDKKEEE